MLGHIIDKYNLVQKSLLPSSLRSEIAEAMLEFVDFAILLLAVGTYIFIQINLSSTIYSTLCIFVMVLTAIYYALPNKRFARNCFAVKREVTWNNLLHYQQATEIFGSDYFTSNPICKESSESKRVRELQGNKVILNEVKAIQAFSEIPEIIPLYELVMRRPTLYEIEAEGLQGLRNPYYSFPQNYGYGASYYEATAQKQSKLTLKTPLINHSNNEDEEANPRKRQVQKTNELARSPLGSSADARERVIQGDNSARGNNSIMKDIMMLPSFQSKGDDLRMEGYSQQRDEHVPSFGMTYEINSVNNHQMTGEIATSQEGGGIIEGISPITGSLVHKTVQSAGIKN
jgi:hypothetical protein